MRIIMITFLSFAATLFIASEIAAGPGSIRNTKHDLSATSNAEIKSTNETRICIFCHSSHNSSKEGPLWNHETTAPGKFKTYKRATLENSPEQPGGSTRLCLSCHDGTIAVGAIKNKSRPIDLKNTGSRGEIPSTRKANFGTDLSGTHPVSVKYDQANALGTKHLRWPPFDAEKKVGPDANGYVQCTSCHDPHDDSKSEKYPFWKKRKFEEVCLVCHEF